MSWLRRLLPVVAAVVGLVVGSFVVISEAQSGDQGSSLLGSQSATTSSVVVTKTQFVADANQICQNMANQVSANATAFQQDVTALTGTGTANQQDAASTPLDGTTTTVPGLTSSPSTVSTATSSTTAAPPASGSYDTSTIQANPLTVINQLINEYMDQLDAIVGMQNDVLNELESLSEPSADELTLQQMWVSMTEAMVAQNQADVVLENILVDYYNAGYISAINGISLGTAEANQISGSALTQDIAELDGSSTPGPPQAGSLEANLTGIATKVDNALVGYGLTQCQTVGLEFQNFQTLADSIPNLSIDYVNTYNQQSNAKAAISLAQILNTHNLPPPITTNVLF